MARCEDLSVRSTFVRGVAIWVLIALAETVQGVLRVLMLQPVVGELRSRQIAVFTGSIVILAIATAASRWLAARSRRELIAVGLLWLGLMLAFEILLGRLVAGFSWERIAADYDPRRGGLLLFGMAVIAVAPLVAARIRGGAASDGPPRRVAPTVPEPGDRRASTPRRPPRAP